MIVDKKNIKNSLFYLVIINLMVTNFIYAQNNKRIDSILKVASIEMYVNPDKVIKNGQIIVNESGKSIDYKIMGYKLIHSIGINVHKLSS